MVTISLEDAELLRDRAWIDGAWVGADSATTFEVRNPSTGDVLARVPDLGSAETERAIAAADAAWPAWRSLTAKERAALLRR